MYEIYVANSKTEKILRKNILINPKIKNKLDRLKENPTRVLNAHIPHGKLKGKWACWLESNLRMIYSLDLKNNIIIIEAIGSHNIY
jgi:addiction module RelE/StbE family toxin